MRANELNLNELRMVAQSGNVDAMVSLAEYYFAAKEWDELEVWGKKAADLDHIVAAYIMTAYMKMDAHITKKLGASASNVLASYRSAYVWAHRTMALYKSGADGVDRVQYEAVNQQCYETMINLAHCMQRQKRFADAIKVLANSNTYLSSLLRGIIQFHMGESDEELEKAYAVLRSVKKCGENRENIGEEDEIITRGACLLAAMERTGLGNSKKKPNLKEAVKVLKVVRDVVEDEAMIGILDKEMACYEKKFLGGWRYVESNET